MKKIDFKESWKQVFDSIPKSSIRNQKRCRFNRLNQPERTNPEDHIEDKLEMVCDVPNLAVMPRECQK